VVAVEVEEEEEEEDASPNLEPDPPAKDVIRPDSPPDLEEESSLMSIPPTPAPRKRGRPKKTSKHRKSEKKAKVVLERVNFTSY
jgi:hypothetical protein